MSNKSELYPLYQTFNHKIPKVDLKKVQKQQLINSINNLNQEQLGPLIRLIAEHYRLTNTTFSNTIENNTTLKSENIVTLFDGLIVNNKVEFDISKFKVELRWILFKFVNVCESSSDK